jgi:hypothetical protein
MARSYERKKTGDVRSYKNISVDPDIIDMMNQKADELTEYLGFRPTISQTLRYLLKHGGNQ